MTPSLVKVNTLSSEPTNGVIRKYRSAFNYFCRLTLVAESHHEVFFNSDKNSTMSKNFLERVLRDGVGVLSDQKFTWLCHSNSSMKNKSFWYISEEGGVVSREIVRQGLGNIVETKQSKKLAREAQNFSSSVSIRKLKPEDVQTIPDKVSSH